MTYTDLMFDKGRSSDDERAWSLSKSKLRRLYDYCDRNFYELTLGGALLVALGYWVWQSLQ